MTVSNCAICGGNHYGTNKCPFVLAPCAICGIDTILACSDCAIDSGGTKSVHVCNKSGCRDQHEATHEAGFGSLSNPSALRG